MEYYACGTLVEILGDHVKVRSEGQVRNFLHCIGLKVASVILSCCFFGCHLWKRLSLIAIFYICQLSALSGVSSKAWEIYLSLSGYSFT